MHQCPKCESENIHRSRSRTRWETWRREITGKRPYRCQTCGWRGWGIDLGPRFGDGTIEFASCALAAEPPGLKGTSLSHDERLRELNLDELDAIDPIGQKRE